MSVESFALEVRRRSSSANRNEDRFTVNGDGAFIVQQIDVLLADPLLLGFTLNRYSPDFDTAPTIDNDGVLVAPC